MKRKKNGYLLLELLISITLLGLCAIPLLSSHPKMVASQMRSLQKVEHERVAHWTITEIVETLAQQKVSWSHIPALEENGKIISLGERSLNFALKQAKIQYNFHTLKEKITHDGTIHRLLSVKVRVGSDEFCFRLIVAHGASQHEA